MGQFSHLLPAREMTLGELIDAAVLASHRFRTCHCDEDCPHDEAAIDASDAVKAHLIKLGLSKDQLDALGGVL
jgi:hypothetical protein